MAPAKTSTTRKATAAKPAAAKAAAAPTKVAAAGKGGKAAPAKVALTRAAKPLPKVEPIDAATLLKADHRAVDQMFDAFDDARGTAEKGSLVQRICTALKIHTTIEEEVFYPALRGKIDDSVIDEAYVEHDGAKVLVNDLAQGKPSDSMYDAKVKVLAEEIRHHVKEEERWLTGMFAKARGAGVDMMKLGTEMAARKAQLEAEGALPVAKPTAIKLVTA